MHLTADPVTYTLGDFLDMAIEPPRWLVEGLIPSHGLIALASPPKVGKSMLAMHLTRALASGDDFVGRRTSAPARVLYIAEEGGTADIQKRFARLERSGVFATRQLEPDLAIQQGLRIDTDEGHARFQALLAATRPALVIIDCLVWVHGHSENQADEMRAVMDRFRALATSHSCAVLFIHHTSKGRDDRTGYAMRGSGVLASATEANLTLRRVDAEVVRLDVELREGEPDTLRLAWDRESGTFLARNCDGERRRAESKIDVLGYLGGVRSATVNEMVSHFSVSDTAVRQRLEAARKEGSIVKSPTGRGREHVYSLRAA